MTPFESRNSTSYRSLIIGADPLAVRKFKVEVPIKPSLLISGIDNHEQLGMNRWLESLGEYLNTNPSDTDFRMMMNKDNPFGFWSNRPEEFLRLDIIPQQWPHRETVGNHIYSVVQKLKTDTSLNGINYLDSSRLGMIKALRVAALFHDIGKARDIGDPKHPQYSADMIESFFDTLKFTPAEAWLCHFLIRYHDFIGKAVNQKEKDAEVDFIVTICNGSPAILQCLRAITIADISSIPGLSTAAEHNVIPEIEIAVQLAYEQVFMAYIDKKSRMISLPIVAKDKKN